MEEEEEMYRMMNEEDPWFMGEKNEKEKKDKKEKSKKRRGLKRSQELANLRRFWLPQISQITRIFFVNKKLRIQRNLFGF